MMMDEVTQAQADQMATEEKFIRIFDNNDKVDAFPAPVYVTPDFTIGEVKEEILNLPDQMGIPKRMRENPNQCRLVRYEKGVRRVLRDEVLANELKGTEVSVEIVDARTNVDQLPSFANN